LQLCHAHTPLLDRHGDLTHQGAKSELRWYCDTCKRICKYQICV